MKFYKFPNVYLRHNNGEADFLPAYQNGNYITREQTLKNTGQGLVFRNPNGGFINTLVLVIMMTGIICGVGISIALFLIK